MKKLYLYLALGAIISMILLSSLIDAFSQTEVRLEDQFAWQSKVTLGFANLIARQPIEARNAYIERASKDFDLSLNYKLGETLALPNDAALRSKMLTKKGLILEDSQGFYLLMSTPELMPDYLELRLDKPEEPANNDVFLTLLFYGGVLTLIAIILSPLAQRLVVLNNAAKEFASGNLKSRIPLDRFTYIRDVEQTFNRMANQIEKLLEENKLMASALSHDIRTPVACLRFGLDVAIEEDDPQELHDLLLRMEKDLDQMEDMLASYLSFATLEQKSHLLNFESVSLHQYADDLFAQVSPKLAKNNLSGLKDINQSIQLSADLHWMARGITNLLNNACDFAQHQILMSAEVSSDSLFIFIEDDGPGIAPENWDKVFSPFFQEQNHRNRAGKSYGLGLAIVSKVVDWHHGTISVSSSERLGGAKFTLKIPCKFT